MEQTKILIDALKALLNGDIIILERIVMKGKCSGQIYVPKEYIGRNIKIFIINENNRRDISGGERADLADEMLPKS